MLINNFEKKSFTDEIKKYISDYYEESNKNITDKFLHLKHELKVK